MAATFPYATHEELEEHVQDAYEVPLDSERIRKRAAELVRSAIGGRAVEEALTLTIHLEALRDAVCAQVEYWLEVGEEHDVAGVPGKDVSVSGATFPAPPRLAVRARRYLTEEGLVSGLVALG